MLSIPCQLSMPCAHRKCGWCSAADDDFNVSNLQAGLIVMHKADSRHELRKRSQFLSVLEHTLMFYRNLLATVRIKH